MAIDKKFLQSKPVLFICGMALMVLGITLVLVWWKDVMGVFRGFAGVGVALAGLFILSLVRE